MYRKVRCTWPRLRGEVDARSTSGEGESASASLTVCAENSPSPQPSPREEPGEDAMQPRGSQGFFQLRPGPSACPIPIASLVMAIAASFFA